jgi:hypothetical protein
MVRPIYMRVIHEVLRDAIPELKSTDESDPGLDAEEE